MLVLLKFFDNDLFVVVDSILAGDVGSIMYLNSEVSRSQHSHQDTKTIDFDAFESYQVEISIKVG